MSPFDRLTVPVRRWPAAAVFVAVSTIGLATASHVPVSDDARFYVPAAIQQARWLEGAARGDGRAWSRAGIEAAFGHNAEHPPVGKLVMASSWLLLHEWTGVADDVSACRAGVTLLWALMCAAVFAAARRYASMSSALFATAALVSMPRLLYHAHAETLDLTVAALVFFAAISLFRTLEAPSLARGATTTLLFALALGAKLNAPFLLVGAAAYLLLREPLGLSRSAEGPPMLRLPPVPLVLIAMVILSPLVTWALWPWLWFDTLARLNTYLLFHLQHYAIHFYYAGTLYGEEVAPVTAPVVMTLLTMPVPLLLLVGLGAAPAVWAGIGRLPWLARANPRATADLDSEPSLRFALFVLLQGAVQLAAVSLPGVPKYGGIKLFLPLLPFCAVLAGFAFARIEQEIAAVAKSPQRRRVLIATTSAVLLAPGICGAVAYRGAWLSYYNSIAGGVRGATAAGYERQYYDLAYPELAAALGDALPDGGTVAVLPNPKEYTPHFARWQREGTLSRQIHLAPPARADVVVITHERRWASYPQQIATHRRRPLLFRYAAFDVPLFSLYGRAGAD